MDTFPIVRRKDEEKHGEYRTKRVILEIYDEMQRATRTGRPYRTRLVPPPADPGCCHPPVRLRLLCRFRAASPRLRVESRVEQGSIMPVTKPPCWMRF